MQVHTNKLDQFRGKKLLWITHSDRPHDPEKCSLNYLESRYSKPDRLPPAEPFESLIASGHYSPYGGWISAYDVGEDGSSPASLVCALRPKSYKPQHCIWHHGTIWIVGVEHVEVYDLRLRAIAKIEDPWLAGGHTIAPTGDGNLIVSCSASDSILWIDETTRRVVKAQRFPESIYGHNYNLARTDSVVDHYITNDQQLTHVNCAWPYKRGALTSALIPGAIGHFDHDGKYYELLRGFVGCHGARCRSDTGTIYFCDSCTGLLILLDEKLAISRRLSTGSSWLHDAVQISGDLFATAIYDASHVTLQNVASKEFVQKIDCNPFGAPQFLWFGF
jgi:hypothetical protein